MQLTETQQYLIGLLLGLGAGLLAHYLANS